MGEFPRDWKMPQILVVRLFAWMVLRVGYYAAID